MTASDEAARRGAQQDGTALFADAVRTLSSWQAPDGAQEALRSAYVEHLRAHPDGLWRTPHPAHVTASALVIDAGRERLLLQRHRKGGFWAQFGGHCEPADVSLAAAALREAVEESGIDQLTLLPGPVDLDRHELSAAFGHCRAHLDVRYVAVASHDAVPSVNPESDDVRWFPVDRLPEGVVDDLGRLVHCALSSGR